MRIKKKIVSGYAPEASNEVFASTFFLTFVLIVLRMVLQMCTLLAQKPKSLAVHREI